jgi:hypothetical protein
MGCQTDIAQKIIDKKADYVLALKENQAKLYQDVVDLFDHAQQTSFRTLVGQSFRISINKWNWDKIGALWEWEAEGAKVWDGRRKNPYGP